MPQQKLTIVPVTIPPDHKDLTTPNCPPPRSTTICTIKIANAEISFFNGIDERTIQTVLRELKHK